MKATYVLNLTVFTILSFLISSCASTQSGANSKLDSRTEIEAELNAQAQQIIGGGGSAAIGVGTSSRTDVARDKAILSAQANLQEKVAVEVSRLRENFLEEIPIDDDRTKFNELFTRVESSVTTGILRGAHAMRTEYASEGSNTLCFVLMAITPESYYQSVMDEVEYERELELRFRASEAHNRLEEKVAKFKAEEESRKRRYVNDSEQE